MEFGMDGVTKGASTPQLCLGSGQQFLLPINQSGLIVITCGRCAMTHCRNKESSTVSKLMTCLRPLLLFGRLQAKCLKNLRSHDTSMCRSLAPRRRHCSSHGFYCLLKQMKCCERDCQSIAMSSSQTHNSRFKHGKHNTTFFMINVLVPVHLRKQTSVASPTAPSKEASCACPLPTMLQGSQQLIQSWSSSSSGDILSHTWSSLLLQFIINLSMAVTDSE